MMMNHEADLALRRNRGKKICLSWLERLGKACAYNTLQEHLLPIEQTEILKRLFVQRTKDNADDIIHRNYAVNSRSLIDALINLSIDLSDVELVLFSSVDKFIGAIQIPARVVLANFPYVWKVVEEDFRLGTVDMRTGLCIESNFYDLTGNYCKEQIWELSAWGALAKGLP